jgi:hypothetical protein
MSCKAVTSNLVTEKERGTYANILIFGQIVVQLLQCPRRTRIVSNLNKLDSDLDQSHNIGIEKQEKGLPVSKKDFADPSVELQRQ